MKAMVNTQYGMPEVLHLEEIEKPIPNDNEVLVKVHATTVNRTDCAVLTGKPFIMRFFVGLFKPKHPIQGTDFAGEVEAIGKEVSQFKVGDNVFGFNDEGLSSHAQYLCINEEKAITTFPNKISFEHAAASIEGAHYAYNFINKVKIEEGQRIMVYGATGAIGSAMVQLLKQYNVHLTAVGNTKNMDLVKSLGPDKVIDYQTEDFTDTNERFDFVFDAVGKSTFGICKQLLKPKGVYISSELGPWAQNIFYSLITPLFGGKKVVFPLPIDPLKSLEYMAGLLEKDAFNAVIDRTHPLTELADAYRYVMTGQKTGNVVILMGH